MARRNSREATAQPPVLIAAASNLRVATYRDALLVSLQRQGWQYRAMDYYEDEGHAHYACSYIGNAMSRIRLVAAKKPDDPKENPIELTTGPVWDAVQQLGSGRAGQKGMLRLLGIHLFLVGECWLVGTLMPTGIPRWEVLSIQELTVLPGDPLTLYRKKLPGASPDPISKDALVLRIWREHPRYSELADSGFRPLLDLFEKILLLNRAEKAAARSRSAVAGLLGIPQELVPPAQQNQESTGDPAEANPFFRQFTEAMMAPLNDEGHSGSVVPIILVGPGDMVNKIKFEPMNRPFETGIRQSIDDAIKQVAHGLDLPAEVLTGVGNSTHWTAWQIKEDTFQAHIQPLIELICDALTTAYLRPAIERARGALLAAGEDADDLDKYIIWYDTRELVIRPDKGDKAVALYNVGALSPEALRRENGFLDSDAPSDDEYNKWVGVKLLDAHMATTGEVPPDQATRMEQQAEVQKDTMQTQADIQTQQHEDQLKITKEIMPPPAAGAANPPKAPQGAKVAAPRIELPRKTGRPKETSQDGKYHTPQGARSKPRPQASARRKSPGPATPSPVKPPYSISASAAERRLAVSGTFSHRLGKIDMSLLKKIQKLANVAVAHAIKLYQEKPEALTAGASAHDLIGDTEFIVNNEAALEAALYDAYEESFGALNGELAEQGLPLYEPEVLATVMTSSIDKAIAYYESTLFNMINERLFNAIDPANFIPGSNEFLVQPGDIRQVIQVAGGGGVSLDLSGYSGGVSTGQIMQDILRQNGAPLEGWLWLYDPGLVRTPFQGHRQLDGFVFQKWDDPELAVNYQDFWIRVPFYFPGDHYGCGCVVVPWTGPDWGGGHAVEV